MVFSPLAQRRQGKVERSAERSERIVHSRRDLMKDLAMNKAVRLHFSELLDQHLLADARNAPSQRAETDRAVVEVPQDKALPLASDDLEDGSQSRVVRLSSRGHGAILTRR